MFIPLSVTAHTQTGGLYNYSHHGNSRVNTVERPLIVLVVADVEVKSTGDERERGRDTHKGRLLVVKEKQYQNDVDYPQGNNYLIGTWYLK